MIGKPHSISIKDTGTWIYIERTTKKGNLIKLGQNVLTNNNVLELKFNKYGVLSGKKILNKKNMQEVKYAKNTTENNIRKKSFVGKFLSSVRQKMQGKRQF